MISRTRRVLIARRARIAAAASGWARDGHIRVVIRYAWVCVCIGLRELFFFFVCVCARAATDRVNAMDDCPMTTASRETVTRSGLARERNARWFLSRVCVRINAVGRSVGDVNSEG